MECNRDRKYRVYINVPDKPTKILVQCCYHRLGDFGVSYCSACKEGKKKLKIENYSDDGIIGYCYKYIPKYKVPNYKYLIKNKKVWAVQHLQHENDNFHIEKLIKDLALGIVKGVDDEE